MGKNANLLKTEMLYDDSLEMRVPFSKSIELFVYDEKKVTRFTSIYIDRSIDRWIIG